MKQGIAALSARFYVAAPRARFYIAAFGALLVSTVLMSSRPAAADTVFLSTQLRPIEEAQKMRDVILKDYQGKVTYVPEQPAATAGAPAGGAAGRHAHDQPDRRAARRAGAAG